MVLSLLAGAVASTQFVSHKRVLAGFEDGRGDQPFQSLEGEYYGSYGRWYGSPSCPDSRILGVPRIRFSYQLLGHPRRIQGELHRNPLA